MKVSEFYIKNKDGLYYYSTATWEPIAKAKKYRLKSHALVAIKSLSKPPFNVGAFTYGAGLLYGEPLEIEERIFEVTLVETKTHTVKNAP